MAAQEQKQQKFYSCAVFVCDADNLKNPGHNR